MMKICERCKTAPIPSTLTHFCESCWDIVHAKELEQRQVRDVIRRLAPELTFAINTTIQIHEA